MIKKIFGELISPTTNLNLRLLTTSKYDKFFLLNKEYYWDNDRGVNTKFYSYCKPSYRAINTFNNPFVTNSYSVSPTDTVLYIEKLKTDGDWKRLESFLNYYRDKFNIIWLCSPENVNFDGLKKSGFLLNPKILFQLPNYQHVTSTNIDLIIKNKILLE